MHMTLTYKRAEQLPRRMCVPTLVLIARAIFLLQHGQIHRQTYKVTDATDHPIHDARPKYLP